MALELAQLTVGERVRRQISRYANPAIVGTLVGSATMNAVVFGAQASNNWLMGAGVALGIAIPALVYLLTKCGAILAQDCHTRQ